MFQATSRRQNCAIITDRRILTAKINLYGISSFHFHCWNQFKVIPLPSTLRTEERKYPKSFAFGYRMRFTHYAIYL